MPTPQTLFLFSGAALLLLLLPGPAVLYVVARGATQGRKAALVSVAGIHVGTLVHITAAAVGLSALIVASAKAFAAIELAGGAYLIWLGIKSLRKRPGSEHVTVATPWNMRRVFTDAVVVNVLNPKTAIFFLAFVPQFVDIEAGHTTVQLLVLGATFIVLGVITDGAYALAAGWISGRISTSPRAERRKDVVASTSYLFLGVLAAAGGARTATS